MKYIDLKDVPGGSPEKEKKPRYNVEEECWWAPGLQITHRETDETIKLYGKTCNCGETLEYCLTHELDRYREDYMIGGLGVGLTPIHKRVKKVVCPKCSQLYDMSVYEKWYEEKHPRRPGSIRLEDVKLIVPRHPLISPRPSNPRRQRTNNDTRYRDKI